MMLMREYMAPTRAFGWWPLAQLTRIGVDFKFQARKFAHQTQLEWTVLAPNVNRNARYNDVAMSCNKMWG